MNVRLNMKPKKEDLMTVGQLKHQLQNLPDDAYITFSCESLEFYRIKQQGDDVFQIQFNQPLYDDEEGNVYVNNLN